MINLTSVIADHNTDGSTVLSSYCYWTFRFKYSNGPVIQVQTLNRIPWDKFLLVSQLETGTFDHK